MGNTDKITLFIPVYNGELTLDGTFKTLELQTNKSFVERIVVIDDASQDKSLEIINKYAENSAYQMDVIRHQTSSGLASSYNEAIKKTKTEYILTMHQDIQIKSDNAFDMMLAPFRYDSHIVTTFPILEHSKKLWKEYTFWQKCLFSRHINREERDLTGKFDLFKVSFLKEVKGFDAVHYRTAGEDADLKHRISRSGGKYLCSGVKVVHAQENNPNFTFKDYFRKESQLAEARGCVLRINGAGGLKDFAANFFREILIIGLFIPYLQFVFLILIVAYAYFYTKLVFNETNFSLQLIKLYFANISLLFVNSYYSVKAFLLERQSI